MLGRLSYSYSLAQIYSRMSETEKNQGGVVAFIPFLNQVVA